RESTASARRWVRAAELELPPAAEPRRVSLRPGLQQVREPRTQGEPAFSRCAAFRSAPGASALERLRARVRARPAAVPAPPHRAAEAERSCSAARKVRTPLASPSYGRPSS